MVGFGAEIAFLLVFPVYMEGAFGEWQAHLTRVPGPPAAGVRLDGAWPELSCFS